MQDQFFSSAKREDDPWEDLVIAILSVNQYKLEKTYVLLESLWHQGLFDPSNLMRWSATEIATRLRLGGCDRGEFMTGLFAERLASLGAFVKSRGRSAVEQVIRSDDRRAIEQLLLPVKGIGPRVVENFFLLRGAK